MADNALVTMGVLDTILPYVKDNILSEVNKKSINTEPIGGDIPVVHITGEIPTTKKYVRIKSADELEDGKQYLIIFDASLQDTTDRIVTPTIIQNSDGTRKGFGCVESSGITDNDIIEVNKTYTAYEFTLEKSGNNWKIKTPDGKYAYMESLSQRYAILLNNTGHDFSIGYEAPDASNNNKDDYDNYSLYVRDVSSGFEKCTWDYNTSANLIYADGRSSDTYESRFVFYKKFDTKDSGSSEIEYISKTDRFKKYIYIKPQGASSLQYPKKNFTIKLYKDKARTIKGNKEFKNWGAHNTFVLKADYIDITHARNVVGANIWSQIVASRPDYDALPEELKSSPNNGAIDGFIVKVYINNNYEGLYNWTIPKDAWMFNMNRNNENHIVLCAETNDNGDTNLRFNPCNFNRAWSGIDGEHWSIEVGKESERLTSSFNRIYESVYNDDIPLEERLDILEECLDIQSMIDYFIFQDVMFGINGLAKNMLMVTYDMTKWYLSAYDLDSICGLYWDGSTIFNSYDIDMGTAPYANEFSELINLLRDFYWDEYILRYKELRSSVLSTANIVKLFEDYINVYGEDLWIRDTIPYPDIPSITENNFINLQEFIKNRVEYLDDTYLT